MEDIAIIEMYHSRNEDAIRATDEKYGAYCKTIAYNILSSLEDSDETVNETYYNVWNAIPPEKPNIFKSYLGRITRNLSINKYNNRNAKKRGKGEASLILDELSDLYGIEQIEETVDCAELTAAINRFLQALSQQKRVVFVLRYFYCESISAISARTALSESNVKQILMRSRVALKQELYEGGFEV